jgi:hypothetical protein
MGGPNQPGRHGPKSMRGPSPTASKLGLLAWEGNKSDLGGWFVENA